MKRFLLPFLLPLLLAGEDFSTLLRDSDANLRLQAKKEEIAAKEALQRAAEAKNLPTVDASLQALYLKDHPTMILHLPLPGIPPEFQVGKQQNYVGALQLSYPIFSGFAISSMIERARFDAQKSELEYQDARRKLYLRIASIYGALYGLDAAIEASHEALDAIDASLKKARGFYRAGLLAPSELENIKAKKFETKAQTQDLIAQKAQLLEQLSYLANSRIEKAGPLPTLKIDSLSKLLRVALEERSDIRAIKKALKMDEAELKLARSVRYPTLFLQGGLKTEGENIKLNGNGYTNPNKSYLALSAEWKLYDGGEAASKIEAAKAKRLGRLLYLKDYEKAVETRLRSAWSKLLALHTQEEAKNAQLAAQESYYELTKGRFENHLADADELSRAIAARARAKADLRKIEAEIFVQKCRILLEGSLRHFMKALALKAD